MNKVTNVIFVCGSILLLLALAFVYRHHNSTAHVNQTAGAVDASADAAASSSNPPSPAKPLVFSTAIPPVSDNNPPVPLAGWSEKVDALLAADVPESDKVRQLLEMFPRLPEEGQVEVANHLSNLLPNEDYPKLAAFATNTTFAPEALDVLLRDAMNRPNSLKLPVLIDVAADPRHPKAADAKETLVFLLGEDEGDDWSKWREKAAEWLKANPD
jgi:hypothetical protein